MATHDLDLVRQTTHRVIELREGAVVYDSAETPIASEGIS
jgi:ABC-type ATPase involved in cell division